MWKIGGKIPQKMNSANYSISVIPKLHHFEMIKTLSIILINLSISDFELYNIVHTNTLFKPIF